MMKQQFVLIGILGAVSLNFGNFAKASDAESDFGLFGDKKKFTCEVNKKAYNAGAAVAYAPKGLKCDPKENGRDGSLCHYEAICSAGSEGSAVIKTRPVLCAIQIDGKCPEFVECFKQSKKIMKADEGMAAPDADADGASGVDSAADAAAKEKARLAAEADAAAKEKARLAAEAARAKAEADAAAKENAKKKRSKYNPDHYGLPVKPGPTYDAGVRPQQPVEPPPPVAPPGAPSAAVSSGFMAKVKALPEPASHMDILIAINQDEALRKLQSHEKLAIAKKIEARQKRLQQAKGKVSADEYQRLQDEPILTP